MEQLRSLQRLLLKNPPSLSLSLSSLQACSFRIWASCRPQTTLQAALAQLGAAAGTIHERLLEMPNSRNATRANLIDELQHGAAAQPSRAHSEEKRSILSGLNENKVGED